MVFNKLLQELVDNKGIYVVYQKKSRLMAFKSTQGFDKFGLIESGWSINPYEKFFYPNKFKIMSFKDVSSQSINSYEIYFFFWFLSFKRWCESIAYIFCGINSFLN